ncbi:MAG: precorrin-8X methylmutase [Deltaproteobacteria bacterium]|nr:precorrin-8X methylmutase [Deltaproteobacteria bacterium]
MQSDIPENAHGNRSSLVEAGRRIEAESFRIIDAEMGPHDFPEDQWQIVRRVIHTTGDFDHAARVRIHSRAVSSGVAALRSGASIIADTRMIEVGLSPWRLRWFGNSVLTPAADPRSQQWAESTGTTRSVAAFRHCRERLNGSIVAVGNAPTALLEVIRQVEEEAIRPALVIGVPVGFVQALESKQLLWNTKDLPSITILSRKGGSTVAVAIIHALLELAHSSEK